MTIGEFKQLVRDMRAAQKEFFKTRSRESLRRSKDLEKQVDELLKPAEPIEEDLFGPPIDLTGHHEHTRPTYKVTKK